MLDGTRFWMDTVATPSEDSATLFWRAMSMTEDGSEEEKDDDVDDNGTMYAAQYTRQSCELLSLTAA